MFAAQDRSTGIRPARVHAEKPSLVAIVDDDALMLSALRRLLLPAGFAVETYQSGAALLADANLDQASCVILDARMPEMAGVEVQARLKQCVADIPVIFLSGSADIPIAVAAMREGALDFIQKPFDRDKLIACVRRAVDLHDQVTDDEERRGVLSRLHSLTPREHSVLELVVVGRTCKQIARSLGGSHRTIEVHRHHLMEKMAASTLADLVRMRLLAGDEPIH
jgi:FixJ family two-component response regulator